MTDTDQKTAIVTILMTPDMQNLSGNIHGGDILKLLDRAAYTCAARYAKNYVVTVSVDQVVFKKPVHVGDIVTFYASVNRVWHSSMEIGVKVVAENPLTGEKRHTNTCYLTWVALDKNHKPTQVPALTPETDVEKRRYREAGMRRELRKEIEERHQAIKTKQP